MKDEENNVKLDIIINAELVRSATTSAKNLRDVALEVPVINPGKLTLDSKIFGLTAKPVDDKIKQTDITDDTPLCLAVKPIMVETLAKNITTNCITVNGRFDIPFRGGSVVPLKDLYVASQEEADEIAAIVTEVMWEKAMEQAERAQKVADFLKNQFENKLF